MLPISNMNVSSTRLPSRLPEFLRRILRTDQMELDSALSQMWSLVTSHSTVLRLAKARKMTKNHYYRDDPAFLVLQVFFLTMATICFGVTFKAPVLLILYNMVYQVAIDFFVFGTLFATLVWVFANRVLMTKQHGIHEVRRDVEWQYSFDIHCNAYFIYMMLTHVLQFFMVPILMHSTFFSQLLANLLYAAAFTLYFYHTFRSYLDLPMLSRQVLLLYPAVGIVPLCLLMTITTRINMTHVMIHHVWPEG